MPTTLLLLSTRIPKYGVVSELDNFLSPQVAKIAKKSIPFSAETPEREKIA